MPCLKKNNGFTLIEVMVLAIKMAFVMAGASKAP